jgi:hypothetical protein
MLAASSACKPYGDWGTGEFYAGPFDATNFPIQQDFCDCPKPTQGQPPNTNCSGPTDENGQSVEAPGELCWPYNGKGYSWTTSFGTFEPIEASVEGRPVIYYHFPAPQGTLVETATRKRALVYVFDPNESAGGDEDSKKCTPPKDYVYDVRTDYIRLDRQANIFQQKQSASYPVATPADVNPLSPSGFVNAYTPVYAQVPVTSMGIDCNSLKSAEGVVTSKKVNLELVPKPEGANEFTFATGKPDGTYRAFAIIDPAADVKPNSPTTLLGPQRWGYIDHYLVAYIDGGILPTMPGMRSSGGQMIATVEGRAQALYFPSTVMGEDENGNPTPVDGAPFTGHDVLEAARGDGNYSPLCHVFMYYNPTPEAPATSVAEVMAAAQQAPTPDEAIVDTGRYVYCLQPAAQQ